MCIINVLLAENIRSVDDEYIPVYPWHALVPCMIRHISTQTALEDNSSVPIQKDDPNHDG